MLVVYDADSQTLDRDSATFQLTSMLNAMLHPKEPRD
jgi:hypothetical protein